MSALRAVWLLVIAAAPDPAGFEAPPAEVPYQVHGWLELPADPRIPVWRRGDLRYELARTIDRLVGRAWVFQYGEPPPAADPARPPSAEEMKTLAKGADKVLWVRIRPKESPRAEAPHFQATLREYDALLEEWGPLRQADVDAGPELCRDLFDLMLEQFRPVAFLSSAESAQKCRGAVKGLALVPRADAPALVAGGRPFRVYREFFSKGARTARVEVPWTYVVFRAPTEYGYLGEFDVLSGLRNPLTGRTRQRSRLVAIAVGPFGDAITELQYVTGPEKRPVVGYAVTVRPQEQSTSVSLGNTDHRGQIAIRPVRLASDPVGVFRDRVLFVNLLAGKYVAASFPLVPGEQPRMSVRVQVDPILTDASGRVLALQEEVVDVVARRIILQRRLEKAAQANDIAAAKRLEGEINALPDKAAFEKRLAEIKNRAEEQRKAADRKTLSVAVGRLFLQTESLLGEYFKNEKVSVSLTETPAPEEKPDAEKKVETQDKPTDDDRPAP